MTSSLQVHVEIDGTTLHAGTAYFTHRGSLSTSFRYEPDYLSSRSAYSLDPALPLYQGQHHVEGLPGAFSDCAPDRWGRNLIRQRRRAEASLGGDVPREITDVDYLIGVSDLTRQGALRFADPGTVRFLDPDARVPRLVELPALLRASDKVARDRATLDDYEALKVLLGAGTATLGGARPKASIRDDDRLWIAKFPHHADDWDVMAWEKTALDLADAAGIQVPERRLVTVDGRGVLLLARFDRDGSGRRGYMSALTMLEARDGEPGDYLEIAETLPEHGLRTGADLRELFRRIAFNVAVHNTDDHLRNHGFLRQGAGWRLSPAFDINPNPDTRERRTTAISGVTSRADELEALRLSVDAFGLSDRDAATIVDEVLDATEAWERVAAANGIPEAERARFSETFDGFR